MMRPDGSARPSTSDVSRRERMLDAALATFSEHGFDGASTREIASRAGVNQGLVTYYFGSKEGLWREAVDRAFAELREGVGLTVATLEAGDGRLGRAEVAGLLRQLVRFAAAHPEFHRLMADEGKRDGPRMHWIVDRHVRPLYEAIARLAARGAEGPLAVALDPMLLHYLLVGATTHLFHQAPECRRLTGRDPSEPEVVERLGDALVALFLGPDPEPAPPPRPNRGETE